MTIIIQNPAQIFVFCLVIIFWTCFTAWAAADEGNDWAKLLLCFVVLVAGIVGIFNLWDVIHSAL